MKKKISIAAIVISLIVIFLGSSECISGSASKVGRECFVDAGLGPIIIIIICLYLLRSEKSKK